MESRRTSIIFLMRICVALLCSLIISCGTESTTSDLSQEKSEVDAFVNRIESSASTTHIVIDQKDVFIVGDIASPRFTKQADKFFRHSNASASDVVLFTGWEFSNLSKDQMQDFATQFKDMVPSHQNNLNKYQSQIFGIESTKSAGVGLIFNMLTVVRLGQFYHDRKEYLLSEITKIKSSNRPKPEVEKELKENIESLAWWDEQAEPFIMLSILSMDVLSAFAHYSPVERKTFMQANRFVHSGLGESILPMYKIDGFAHENEKLVQEIKDLVSNFSEIAKFERWLLQVLEIYSSDPAMLPSVRAEIKAVLEVQNDLFQTDFGPLWPRNVEFAHRIKDKWPDLRDAKKVYVIVENDHRVVTTRHLRKLFPDAKVLRHDIDDYLYILKRHLKDANQLLFSRYPPTDTAERKALQQVRRKMILEIARAKREQVK